MKSIRLLIALSLICAFSITALAQDQKTTSQPSNKPILEVYESPSCGCCGLWSEYMAQHGFEVKEIKTNDLLKIKQKYNIKEEFMSCHTAIVNGYIIEGHVPHEQVQRLLKENPKDVIGITVPGMPQGSPGMEQNRPDDTYKVMLLSKENGLAIPYAVYKGKTKIEEFRPPKAL